MFYASVPLSSDARLHTFGFFPAGIFTCVEVFAASVLCLSICLGNVVGVNATSAPEFRSWLPCAGLASPERGVLPRELASTEVRRRTDIACSAPRKRHDRCFVAVSISRRLLVGYFWRPLGTCRAWIEHLLASETSARKR
jgi:hypothetical protein